MNPELAVLKITGLLAAEVAFVCLLALGYEVFVRAPIWRRTLWQVCVVSVLLVTALELSGVGRSIVESARQTAAPKVVPSVTPGDRVSSSGVTAPMPSVDSPPATVQIATKPAPPKAGPRQFVLALACVWIAGAGALLCRIMLTRAIMVAICARSALVTDPALLQTVRALISRMGMRGSIRVVESPRLRGPIAFGLVRRVIGLPLNFSAEYTPAQQEVILAHELAHLAARDSWWQLLTDVALAVLWWHPLVWLSRRRLQEAAEAMADESSLVVPNGPPVLAECLLALGKRMERAPRIRWSGIGGDGFRSGLGRRVQRLLQLRKAAPHRRNTFQMAMAKTFCPAVLVLGTIFSSGWISPAASMKGTGMNTPMWKRSLPAFALLAFLGADQPIGAADKAAPAVAADKPAPATEAVSRSELQRAPKPRGASWVRRKLERITLDFQADNLPLGALVNLLVDEARKRDPEKEGINILLYRSEPANPPAIDPKTGLPILGTTPELIDLNSVTIRVMPPLMDVRLIDVLDAMMKAADYPLRYSIEDYGVLITDGRSKATSPLETRTFVVKPPDIFFKGIKATFGIEVPEMGAPSGVSRQTQVQVFEELFRHLGLDWTSPKTVFYNELTGIVMVRAAQDDMDVITATMQTLGATPLSEANAFGKAR